MRRVERGNRLPAVWIPDKQVRDDRELIRTRLELAEKQTTLKSQVQMLLKRYGLEKPSGVGCGLDCRLSAMAAGVGRDLVTAARYGVAARPWGVCCDSCS
jgi:hypothetical protein